MVNATAIQSDGKVLIAGDFTSVNGMARVRVARLNSDGGLDPAFDPGAGPAGIVHAMTLQPDGKVLIVGEFLAVNGVSRNRIARLNADGSVDLSFNPGSSANATIYAVAMLKNFMVIGGAFTSVRGASRGGVAMLTDTGELVPFFNPGSGVNGTVHAIAVDADRFRIYLAGEFTSFNGSSRNRIARINDSGALDSSFNPASGFDGTVYALTRDFSGGGGFDNGVFAGGSFLTANGLSRPRLARLDTFGTVVSGFNTGAGPDGTVRSVIALKNGKLAVAGQFSNLNGVPRNNVAELDANTADVITAFDPGTGANDAVRALAEESDGKIFVAGQFTSVNGGSRPRIARLYGDGGSAPPATPAQPKAGPGTDTALIVVWSGVSHTTGYRMERSMDGVSGWMTTNAPSYPHVDSSLSPNTTYYYRLRAYSTNGEGQPSPVASATTLATPWTFAGSPDTNFTASTGSGLNSWVYATAVQSDGKILIGGAFSSFDGASRNRVARLKSDGSLDLSFDSGTGPNSSVQTIAQQPDGKILLGGDFTSVSSITRHRIARLNADGSLDTTFAPSSGANSTVKGIVVQPDGRIVIAGRFTTVNGVSCSGIARLNADGTLDTTFSTGTGLYFANGYTLALQPDGKVIVGGFFQSVNGVARGRLARLNSDGSLDPSFATGSGADSWIESLQLQPDGRVVVAGAFSTYNGVARRGVVRLLPDGSLDTSFNPGSAVENGWAFAVVVQPDGKVILGGWFTLVHGAARLRIARLNADGTLDSTFQPGLGANGDVRTLALQPDGICVAGGLFATMNGTPAKYVARLFGDAGGSAPDAPNSLSATTTASTQIELAWSNVAHESGFIVEQSVDGVSGWTQVASTAAEVTSLTVSGLAPGSTSHYRVRAYSTNGDSANSPLASATTYTSIQQWKLDHGLPIDADVRGDWDADGLSDVFEYALGSNPNSAASNNGPSIVLNGAVLELHYRKARSDVTYRVESSTDLQTWTTDDVDQGGSGPMVTASTPVDGGKKFLHLVVTAP